MVAGQSLEQPQSSPEKRLDSGDNKANNTLPDVDRVSLLRQFTPADPGILNTEFPKLTINGWEKHLPGADAGDKQAAQPATQTKEQRIDSAKQALESPESTVKQKMEAMTSLYNDLDKTNGKVRVSLKDNGVERDFEINRQSVGKNVNLIQLRTAEANGSNHPVLRAVERNGEFEQQRNKNGSKADYRGDWWSANAKESTIAKFGQGETAAKPEVRPVVKAETKVEPKVEPKVETVPVPRDKPAAEVVLPQVGPIPEQRNFDPASQNVRPEVKTEVRPEVKPEASPVQTEVEPRKKREDIVIPWKKDRTGADKPSGDNTVEASDIKSFYSRQKDSFSCAGIAAGMMYAKERQGRPLTDSENQRFKELTGTTRHGYRGPLQKLANEIASTGLTTKAYDYGMGNVGAKAMQDLNRELDQGRSAVAKVINPNTGNPHYVFIAGRNSEGKYIIGDPDRKNTQHFRPVSQQYLQSIMRQRDGFVVGY